MTRYSVYPCVDARDGAAVYDGPDLLFVTALASTRPNDHDTLAGRLMRLLEAHDLPAVPAPVPDDGDGPSVDAAA